MRRRLRSASGAGRRLEHHDAVVREHLGQRGVHGVRSQWCLLLGRLGVGPRFGRRAVGDPRRHGERRQRERHVGHQRVAHRRARGFVGIVGDRHQLCALGQQRARDVRIEGKHRAAGHDHEVVRRQRLPHRPDGRRQAALEQRMVLGEAQPPAARERAWPRRAAAAPPRGPPRRPSRPTRPRPVRPPAPGAAPRPVGARGRGSPRDRPPRGRSPRGGSGGPRRPRRPPRPSRPSGSRRRWDRPGAARPGARRAPGRAARPRARGGS